MMKLPFWPFGPQKKEDADSEREETLKSTFGIFSKKLFGPQDNEAYKAGIKGGALELTLKRSDLFGWTVIPGRRYRDFVASAKVSFTGTEHASAGLVFRYANQENYCYFLVSNKGAFRFSAVFNGKPLSLINWTEFDINIKEDLLLRVAAKGSRFWFVINDTRVAEFKDETQYSGAVGFAAQNYSEAETNTFLLKAIEIESRPFGVDKGIMLIDEGLEFPDEVKKNLARTMFSQGLYADALKHMRAVREKGLFIYDDYLFMAECHVNDGDYEAAAKYIDACLEKKPESVQAKLEKGNLKYLQNKFIELRDYCSAHADELSANAVFWNLYGNAEYALGNWSSAVNCYNNAVEHNPRSAVFIVNCAKALEREGLDEEAVENYSRAASILVEEASWDDLAKVLSRMERINPDERNFLYFRGKLEFQLEQYEAVKDDLKVLIDRAEDDSAVNYMYGYCLMREGSYEEASGFFKKALNAEPEFPLYLFKYAEAVFLSGNPAYESIERALEAAPRDAWVLNLASAWHLQQNDPATARSLSRRARELNPEAHDIAVNYSQALFLEGETNKALEVLASCKNKAPAANQAGNIYAASGDLVNALNEYRNALELDSENSDYILNLASVLCRLEQFSEAEGLLVQIYDKNPSPDVHLFLGDIVARRAEWARAEVIFVNGLEKHPREKSLLLALGGLYLYWHKYDKARAVMDTIVKAGLSGECGDFIERVRGLTEEKLVCAGCGRSWWVPAKLDDQGPLKLRGELPENVPAGKCPECSSVYCVGCGKKHLQDGRFQCSGCKAGLTLDDHRIRFILREYLDQLF